MNKNLVKIHSRYIDEKDVKNIFTFFIYATDSCNYSCEYCSNDFPRQQKFLNLTQMLLFIQHIQNITTCNFIIEISGGEPTLHPDLYEFCKKCCLMLKDRLINICIYSNCSQSKEYYLRLLALDNKITFIFTYHHFANREIAFIKTIEYLKPYIDKEQIMIIVMYENQTYMKCIEVFDYIYKHITQYIKLALLFRNNNNIIITHTNKKENYNNLDEYYKRANNYQDLKCYFDDNTSELLEDSYLMYNYNTNFYKWICYAGYRYLSIYINGDVYKCAYNIAQSKLGNIYEKNINMNIFKTPSLCLYNIKCPCIYSVYKEKVFL